MEEEIKEPKCDKDFDIAQPIDLKTGSANLGGEKLFLMMLSKIESMTFLDLMKKIAIAVENGDML